MKELPTGRHTVPVDIKDLQGAGKTQTATVRICSCRNNQCIVNPNSVSFGPMGLLALLLPLFLLLLLGESPAVLGGETVQACVKEPGE